MKDNCKNRKLKFIRDKNRLRLGRIKFYSIVKVYPEMEQDVEYIEYIIDKTKQSLMEKYKLSLNIIGLEKFIDGDDFLKNRSTLRISLSRS